MASHTSKSVSETSYLSPGSSSEGAGTTAQHSSKYAAEVEDWSDFLALGAQASEEFMEHVEDLLLQAR